MTEGDLTTHSHPHFFPWTWRGGVPVHWRGVEAVEQSHRPEPQKGLSTSQGASVCMWLEDGDKIPEAPSPGPPRPLLP